MKILVIGDASSIFIKQYIEYVLLDEQNQIILLQENPLFDDYKKFYENNNIVIEPLWNKYNKFIKNIPVVRSTLGAVIWCSYIKKKYGEFDLIHIHGLNRSRGNLGFNLRNITKKLIISVWGDEIFRNNDNTLAKHKKYYACANCITMATSNMIERFNQIYSNEFSDKIFMNKFAIGLFEKIDHVNETYSRQEICSDFGIETPDRTLVFVGHNGREAQRHIQITTELQKLPKEYQDRIVLIYTMTYGVRDQKYLDELQTEINKLDCDYIILRDFMNELTSAKLRNICDILIHAQLTDGFSASIQESLYSGSIIINGAWLPYAEIPNYKDSFIEYDDISEISSTLISILDNFDYYRNKFKANHSILKNISSRETTTQKWKETLNECINSN